MGEARTVKNAASRLLQQVVETLDGSLVFVVESCISFVRYRLTGDIQPQLLELTQKFDYQCSVETSLMILTLFSEIYLRR
jgi:hypothetical protein